MATTLDFTGNVGYALKEQLREILESGELTADVLREAEKLVAGGKRPAVLVFGGLGYAALLVATGIVRPREWLLLLRGRTPLEPRPGRQHP